jgi:N-acetylglucosamine-6-phosphate deacetylase
LTLPAAVTNAVRFTGLPLAEVLPLATTQPAALLGLRTAGRVTADWDAAAGILNILSVDPHA